MPRAQHRQIDFPSLASQIRQDGNEGHQAAEGPGKGKYGVKEDRGRSNAQHPCAGGSERKKVVPHFGAPIIYKLANRYHSGSRIVFEQSFLKRLTC